MKGMHKLHTWVIVYSDHTKKLLMLNIRKDIDQTFIVTNKESTKEIVNFAVETAADYRFTIQRFDKSLSLVFVHRIDELVKTAEFIEVCSCGIGIYQAAKLVFVDAEIDGKFVDSIILGSGSIVVQVVSQGT